jgi:hypothetical protein
MTFRTSHVLAILGAVIVFVATAITWYTHDVSVATNATQVAYESNTSFTLWDVTTLAPVLLVVAAAVGVVVLLFAPLSASRATAIIAGLLGLGITAYCVVKCFNFPDLGPTGDVTLVLPGAGAAVSATASTTLNAGPFVGIVGGLLMAASALGLAEAPETAAQERGSSSYAGLSE